MLKRIIIISILVASLAIACENESSSDYINYDFVVTSDSIHLDSYLLSIYERIEFLGDDYSFSFPNYELLNVFNVDSSKVYRHSVSADYSSLMFVLKYDNRLKIYKASNKCDTIIVVHF